MIDARWVMAKCRGQMTKGKWQMADERDFTTEDTEGHRVKTEFGKVICQYSCEARVPWPRTLRIEPSSISTYSLFTPWNSVSSVVNNLVVW
jgi:hypothetical protein